MTFVYSFTVHLSSKLMRYPRLKTQFVLVREAHRNLIDTINYQKICKWKYQNGSPNQANLTCLFLCKNGSVLANTICVEASFTYARPLWNLFTTPSISNNFRTLESIWWRDANPSTHFLFVYAFISVVVKCAWNSHKLFHPCTPNFFALTLSHSDHLIHSKTVPLHESI